MRTSVTALRSPVAASTPSPLRAEPPSPIQVALFLGLAAGVAEVALLGIAKFVLHRFPVYRGVNTVWTTPVSLTLLLVAGGLALAVLDRGRHRTLVRTAAMGILAYLAAFDLLLLATRVHWLARIILAAGLAASFVRICAAHPRGSARWLRYGTRVLAVVVLLVGAATFGLLRFQEARREAALPPADTSAPNVLLLILDTVRSSNMGLYGYARPTTPELARFAARGVVFDRALSPSSWTLPSHASIFTGRWAAELGADWHNPLDSRDATLAEVFSRRGYRTAGFVANVEFASTESGLDRGFVHYEDYRLTIATIGLASSLGQYVSFHFRRLLHLGDYLGRKKASNLRQDIEHWVQTHPDRPYFVFANFFDAHYPYYPPPPYDTLFAGRRLRWEDRDPLSDNGPVPPPQIVRNEEAMYDGAIASIDAELGHLLAAFERSGARRNTVVIVTSDHGEEFGEHGLLGHGHDLYLPSLRVPLVIVAPPTVPAGVRIPQWISLRDLAATIVDLAGAPATMPGRSLARYWNGAGATDTLFAEVRYASGLPATYPVSRGDIQSAFGGDWRIIKTGTQEQELFDLATDSLEMRNRSRDSPIPLARLGEALRHGPSHHRR